MKISQNQKQVRWDNDASELVILGQLGEDDDEFGTLERGWPSILNDSDHSYEIGSFSQSVLTISAHFRGVGTKT